NLEVTLPGKPPYQGWPNFKSPDDLARALRIAGFDLLTTANNHSNDAGKNGVIQTINTLQSNGFYHTGTYRDSLEKELYHPLVVYKKGFKLAFLNYTYGTDQKKHRPPTVVNVIDEVQIKRDLQQCQKLNVDASIVLLHWGKEYQIDPSEKQEQLARRLAHWGADLVIGSHPHVVQGVEEYFWRSGQNEKEKMSLLAYSLGNFISNQQKAYTDGGIILGVDLIKTEGDTQIEDHYYLPIWRFIRKNEAQGNSYHCIPISAYERQNQQIPGLTKRDLRKMQAYAQFLRQHLNKSDCPERPLSD
ncbi:MAG: CapA family protein, partial [Bacteroidota bacterium]